MLFRQEAQDIDRKVDEEVNDLVTEVKLMSEERDGEESLDLAEAEKEE